MATATNKVPSTGDPLSSPYHNKIDSKFRILLDKLEDLESLISIYTGKNTKETSEIRVSRGHDMERSLSHFLETFSEELEITSDRIEHITHELKQLTNY